MQGTAECAIAFPPYELERLQVKQTRDITLWHRHVDSLQKFSELENYADEVERLNIKQPLEMAPRTELEKVQSTDYLEQMQGMIGTDPRRLE